ncbi:MAG TPA: SDR family oxidoreductase [Beijerinckiaceae bacterium]|nr:SDR family oxidoreductase [Beijerinckiaceae bacterium]
MSGPQGGLALVTGASGGIGADIARVLARRGLRLGLVARSADKLAALAAEIGASGGGSPLVFALDLGEADGPARLQAAVRSAGLRVEVLVNNAGFGLAGQSADLDRPEQLAMIDLNIRSLVDLTLRFGPDLVASRGRLMNVASVAAFFPGPGMAVYYATKAFVLSYSEAIAQEMKASGVSVTALCPGMTATGFQERAGMAPGLDRLAPSMSSMSVAEAGVAGLFAGRRVVVPGMMNKLFTSLAALTPHAAVLPVLHRAQSTRAPHRDKGSS